MQTFYLVINAVFIVALLGLGFVAVLKNYKQLLNRVFTVFTVTISIWIAAAYISNLTSYPPIVSVVGNYFVFLFSYISSYLLLWFAVTLTSDKKAARFLKRFIIPIILCGAISGSSLVVAGVHQQGDVYAVDFGPLVAVYGVSILFALAYAVIVLHRNKATTTGDQKRHVMTLYRATVIAIPLLLITEFILPALTGWFGLTNVGILAMVIIVFALYYSVVRLRLFNLRLVAVRSLAYVLTLTIIGFLFSLGSYYLTRLINANNSYSLQELVNIAMIIVALNAYGPTIKFFRRTTNSLFYRDAYDSQALFSQINQALVSNVNFDGLLKNIARIINEEIKSQYTIFYIKGTDGAKDRIVNVGDNSEIPHPMLEHLFSWFEMSTNKYIMITDDLNSSIDREYQEVVNNQNVSVIMNLLRKSHKNEESIGYMIIGAKKSGNPYNKQDIDVLSTIKNELIIAVQNILHFEEIQQFNETLQQKVEEATRKLKTTNEKLKRMDETKDEFISMASHQLRTPLTSVKGYVSMVLDGDAGPISEQQRELLSQSFSSSQRMANLISDLLNLSRINTGKFVIESTPVYLPTIIEAELHQLRDMAQAKTIELKLDVPSVFPTLMLDEGKMHQVVMNLVDNAIYYTPEGGKVTVQLTETPTAVEFRVIDTGIGVPKDSQHRLFTKMFRAENAQRARPDGTGLGLFLVKKVVVSQGGAIIFDSVEGKGSTFGFHFNKKDHLADETTTVKPSGLVETTV